MGKIIALDFGLKRTGIAISDEQKMFAFGLETVESKKLMVYLKNLINNDAIETIVLGEPKYLDGSPMQITQNVLFLKEELEKTFPNLSIYLHDERFTSKMAFNTITNSGLSKKKRQNKALIDKVSATIILQEFLEKTN